jgi:hypothetical protein
MYIKKTHILDRTFRGYVVQQVTHHGRYHIYFSSLASFLVYYATIPREERTFNEVIVDGPQKMRIDIDSTLHMTECSWNTLIELVSRTLQALIPDGVLLIYDMSDEAKRSCHVIVDGIHLESSSHCKYLCSQVVSSIPDEYRYTIDMGVYKSLQYFRMEGSTKLCTTRYKILDIERCKDPHTILDSLVAYVTNSKLMTLNIDRPVARSSVSTLWSVCITSSSFNIRKIQGNMVILNRMMPSLCRICKRVHTSENAYIVITSNVQMYFKCWRSNMALYIGTYTPCKPIDITTIEA